MSRPRPRCIHRSKNLRLMDVDMQWTLRPGEAAMAPKSPDSTARRRARGAGRALGSASGPLKVGLVKIFACIYIYIYIYIYREHVEVSSLGPSVGFRSRLLLSGSRISGPRCLGVRLRGVSSRFRRFENF